MISEDTLIRARRLESEALTEIHDRFYPEIYRYVRYRLDDQQVCEDIAAEVFLRLLNALHSGGGPTKNMRGWLFGTASNLVNDHLRSRYARKAEPLEMGSEQLASEDRPEDRLDESYIHMQVRQAIQKLTDEQQHVLALRFAQEFSLDETASIMGKSVTAVKALQFRAIASLRRIMGRVDH
jgi:RNA polymerase sigma-70 factor (ECF subfamily)